MSARTTEFAAKLTGDANGALAAMERVKAKAKETAAASEQSNAKLDASTAHFVKNTEKAARGVAAINNAIYGLEAEGSARILALGSSVGAFADLLGPQGKVVSGLAIVASSIVALFMQAKEKAAEATKSMEADLARLVNAGDFAAIKKRMQEIDQGTAAGGFQDGRTAIQQRIADLQAEYNAVGKTNRYYLERADKIRAEKQRLGELSAEWARYYKALTDPNNAQASARGLAGAPITSTADSVEAQQRRAEKIADAAKKEAEAFAQLVQSINLDIGRIVAKAEQDQRELAAKTVKQLTDESSARQQTNTDLQAQVAAIQEGTGAYDALLVKQAQAIAVEKALSAARAAGIDEKTIDTQKIREQIAETARLTKLLEALRSLDGKNPFSLDGSVGDVGQFAENLSIAASAAAGIATAFGSAGQRMASLLGQSAQLFTNLSRAQKAGVFTDLNGKEQNVGFLGAISGKAGASGTVAAVSGALGVIGAVVSLGSALDLFGGRAKKRAQEIAEASAAFRDGFAAFSAKSLGQDTAVYTALTSKIKEYNALVAELVKKYGSINKALDTIDFANVTRDFTFGLKRIAEDFASSVDEAFNASIGRSDLSETAKAQREYNDRLLQAKQLLLERAITEEEYNNLVEKSGAIFDAALRKIAAAEEAARRSKIFQSASDDVAILGLTGVEKLRRGTQAFDEAFADFAGTFANFDLSTREGLQQAKDAAKALYRQLAEGGITESEQAVIDWLRTFVGDVDSVLSTLPGVLDPVAAGLEAFNARVKFFGTGAQQQLVELAGIFRGKFGDWFDAMLGTVDLGNADSRNAFRQTIEDQINAILSDGVISEGERALYEALQLFLGVVTSAIDQAAADAAQAAQDALATRQANRISAQNQIQLFGLTGLDALRVQLDALGPAFAGLFAQFDLTTVAGLEAAQGALKTIFTDLSAMTDEEILAKFGMTRDEVVAALLDTNSGLNGLKSSLNDVAQSALNAANAAKEFSDQIADDYLRSQGRNEEADRAAALRKRDDRLKQAAQLGLGPEIIAQIESIYQADLLAIAARYAPKATDAVALAGSGVASGAGLSSNAPATSEAARPKTRNTTLVQDFGGLSELTAQSMAGLLREIAINTGDAGAIVRALTRLPTMPLSSLQFPTYSAASAGGGSTFVFSGTINVQVGAVASTGASLDEVGYETARAVSKHLGRMARAGVMYLGDGRA